MFNRLCAGVFHAGWIVAVLALLGAFLAGCSGDAARAWDFFNLTVVSGGLAGLALGFGDFL